MLDFGNRASQQYGFLDAITGSTTAQNIKKEGDASDTNSLAGDFTKQKLEEKHSKKNTRRSSQIVPASHEQKLPPVNRKFEVMYKRSGKKGRSAEGKEVMNGSVQMC